MFEARTLPRFKPAHFRFNPPKVAAAHEECVKDAAESSGAPFLQDFVHDLSGKKRGKKRKESRAGEKSTALRDGTPHANAGAAEVQGPAVAGVAALMSDAVDGAHEENQEV